MYTIYIKRKLISQRFEKYKKLNFHENGPRLLQNWGVGGLGLFKIGG